MEDVKRDIKWMDTCIKTRVPTSCCCANSGEEGVMENVRRDKCVHKVDGHMHKNKSTYSVLARDFLKGVHTMPFYMLFVVV